MVVPTFYKPVLFKHWPLFGFSRRNSAWCQNHNCRLWLMRRWWRFEEKASRDRQLWANLHMLEASSLLRIYSSSTLSASNTHVPIKAKIVQITSHLHCPSFFASQNKPHNKDRESYTSHTRCSSFLPFSPPSRAHFRERDDHLVELLDLSLPAEILLKW